MKYLFTLLAVFFLVSGCRKPIDSGGKPGWTLELLGPLVKTDLTLNKILGLETISATQNVNLADIGIGSGTQIIIPPINNVQFPDYTTPITDIFEQLTIESGRLSFEILNSMPINIKAGSKITFFSQGDNVALFSHALATDIASNGGTYSFTPGFDLAGKIIKKALVIRVEEFSSDGSIGPVNISGNESFSIAIKLEQPVAESVWINSGNELSLDDTLDFNMVGNDLPTDTYNGKLTLFVNNGLPADFYVQLYFLNDNKNILDSMFVGNTNVSSALINGSGEVTDPVETRLEVTFDNQRINDLENANYAVPVIKMVTTPGNGTVVIRKTDFQKQQLVADVKVDIQ